MSRRQTLEQVKRDKGLIRAEVRFGEVQERLIGGVQLKRLLLRLDRALMQAEPVHRDAKPQ